MLERERVSNIGTRKKNREAISLEGHRAAILPEHMAHGAGESEGLRWYAKICAAREVDLLRAVSPTPTFWRATSRHAPHTANDKTTDAICMLNHQDSLITLRA
ncbi:MAG: hypothetical protein Q7T94_06580 [Rugosibacter sp.]|nr:hypothetical protein [Rugosibacter sp.]